MCSRATGQERAGATCLDRRQVASFEARSGVADTENTAMNGDEPAFRQPLANLLTGDAGAKELLPGNDTVRAARQLCEFRLDCADLLFHQNS